MGYYGLFCLHSYDEQGNLIMKFIKLDKSQRPTEAQRKQIKEARKARANGRGKQWSAL